MKKIYFISTVILGLIISFNGNSQVVLENSFNYSATYTALESAGSKYYLMDVNAEQCRLYNQDYTLWKTVNFNIPNRQWLTDIQFASQHLFNTDDLVEFLIIYYEYIETANSYYYIYSTQIVNELGTVLLTVPGGAYAEVKSVSSDESKLFIYVYDYSSFPYSVETNIYSIPGMLTGINEQEFNLYSNALGGNEARVYPNPSNGQVKLRMNPAQHDNNACLVVSDASGSIVRRLRINAGLSDQSIPDLQLNNGVYFYHIDSEYYQSKPKKMVILK